MILLLACAQTTDSGVDMGDPAEELVLPDVSGVDFAGAYKDAIQRAKTVSVSAAWIAHADLLERRVEGCPDLWAGVPDDDAVDVDSEEGSSWYDHCSTGATDYDGWAWWDASIAVEGDADTPEGRTTDASRELSGNALIADGSGVQLELDGDFSDALSRSDAQDYAHWTWSTASSGTITLPTESYRTDLSVYASGGDENTFEPTGNVYLFNERIQDRFDSFEMDLAFAGEGAAAPEDCTAEPKGWIGVRDENAYWYDIVFQPRYDEDGDTGQSAGTYTDCDGCGTVYVRGVEAAELGEVCLDFGFVWSESPVSPPNVEDYVLSLHGLEAQ